MSKFSRGLDSELVQIVKEVADEMHLRENGINIEAVCLNKSKKDIGVVVLPGPVTQLFTGDDATVVIALYEPAFNRVDTEVKKMWIRGLVNQISYDFDKDKIIITKPEMHMSLGLYQAYKDEVVRATELQILTMQQITEEEAERKKKK